MAQLLGRDGSASIAGTVIGEIRNWTLTEGAGSIANNTMGSGEWDTSVTGRKNWSAEVSLWLDPADAGQILIINGEELALLLHPEGETTGLTEYSGTGRIEEITRNGDGEGDSLFEYSCKLMGVGALVHQLVPS